MIIVALDCFAMGFGARQFIFSENAVWLWHVIGIGWLLNALWFVSYSLLENK